MHSLFQARILLLELSYKLLSLVFGLSLCARVSIRLNLPFSVIPTIVETNKKSNINRKGGPLSHHILFKSTMAKSEPEATSA